MNDQPRNRDAARSLGCVMTLIAALSSSAFAAESPGACADAVTTAPVAQAEQLFDGALACASEERESDTIFLMIAGQVRAMSDMGMFAPRANEPMEAITALYGRLYYQMGGAGRIEFYTNEASVRTLFGRMAEWTAAAGTDRAYRPSWKSEPVVDMADYAALLAEQWMVRKQKLEAYAESARDPEHVRLQGELEQLMRENPRGFDVGTPTYERMQLLQAALSATRRSEPVEPPATPISDRIARVQDPANVERTLHVGFSGRAESGAEVFQSADAATRSWLGGAIPRSELDTLLAKVDFATESLFVLSLGESTTATGEIALTALQASDGGWFIAASRAVQPRGCDAPQSRSYPFIVARGPRVADDAGPGQGVSNTPGPCSPAMSGTPAED